MMLDRVTAQDAVTTRGRDAQGVDANRMIIV
jgi:hypothetical protein